MLFPLRDENPLRIIPFQFVTVSIIAICVLVYFYQATLPQGALMSLVTDWGFVPERFFDREQYCYRSPGFCDAPTGFDILTSMFLHGGLLHLGGNMLFLWIYGDNVEDSMGHVKFAVFYVICGIAAAMAQGLADPASQAPTIGASGAIGGVLGAYLMLHPRVKVLVLVLFRFPIRLPAFLVIGIWLALQVWNVAAPYLNGGAGLVESNVAWWAHLGGFLAGVILTPILKDPRVPLFDRGVAH